MMSLVDRVVFRWMCKQAGSLQDVSKLRYQAVFMMGAGGSGKGVVGLRWMKYMPGSPPGGFPPDVLRQKLKETFTEQQRSLSNLKFQEVVDLLNKKGIEVDVSGGSARIPFKLYTYDQKGGQRLVPPEEWEQSLPPEIYSKVKGLTEVIFSAPVHELPSYWRQADPDMYKKELQGYLEKEPGYVHEMSSDMSKSYFEAVLKSGDPLFVDGTGANEKSLLSKIDAAKNAGYRTSLVFVSVPLVVNQIRNATRSRVVSPVEVVNQWSNINKNYAELRGKVDVAKVIINRNDSSDIQKYKKDRELIEKTITTRSSYASLYDLIRKEAPSELREWGELLSTGATESVDRRRERFDRLEDKRKQRGLEPRPFLARQRIAP